MNDKEKEAVQMLKAGFSITYVAQKTELSAFWLSMIMNMEKI